MAMEEVTQRIRILINQRQNKSMIPRDALLAAHTKLNVTGNKHGVAFTS